MSRRQLISIELKYLKVKLVDTKDTGDLRKLILWIYFVYSCLMSRFSQKKIAYQLKPFAKGLGTKNCDLVRIVASCNDIQIVNNKTLLSFEWFKTKNNTNKKIKRETSITND